MSAINTLKMRLDYHGGPIEEDRLKKDKIAGLKKALISSYQGATAILADNREFRCLINPNKETEDYNNKIISIPFKDVCLNADKVGTTTQGVQTIGLKCGDVITWKENNTHWLVFLQYLNETAYFRAQIRKCEQETKIGDKTYWTYIRGPVETSVVWNQKGGVEWNDLNYSLVMYISKDENTIQNIHRFAKIKILEPSDLETDIYKTWEVVGVNPYFGDGVIEVFLDETYENSIADEAEIEAAATTTTTTTLSVKTPYIEGDSVVIGYSTVSYTIKNTSGGTWYIGTTSYGTDDTLTLDVTTNKGSFTILYKQDDEIIAQKEVTVKLL